MADEANNKPRRRSERIGKYEILEHIATGGMGAVYKARDVDLDRLVALKILPPQMAAQEKMLLRFRREAQAAAQLKHENIVAIFDVGESHGTYYLALEYVEGMDLQNYITRKCRLDPEEARQILIQAARALVHAHQHGVVHRDIKPSNFLLTITEQSVLVKLTDFGLAMRNENDAEFRITRDGTTVGTVDYISPEQARDSKAADIRSDIYSLGCTFFHMLAGTAPFARGSLPERLIQHMQAPPPDVRKLNKIVPDSFVAIINRMLAKKPEDRYQTPTELLHDLENHANLASPVKRTGVSGGPGATRTKSIDPTRPKQKADEAHKEKIEKERETPSPRKVLKKPRSPVPEVEVEVESSESDSEVGRRKKAKKPFFGQPWWVIAAAGSAIALILVCVLSLAFSSKPPRPKQEDLAKTTTTTIVQEVTEKKIDAPPVVVIDTSPTKMTVAAQPFAVMEVPLTRGAQLALTKEFRGPFTLFPEAPENATTLQVRRLSTGQNSYRTLADALAQTRPKNWTVIEIHDNGPIPVPSLALLSQRSVVLRAGAGYRPLLAWDVPKTPGKEKESAMMTLTQGKLVLDHLDFVVRWPSEQPGTLFDLQDADLYARDCTFSLTEKSKPGFAFVTQRELVGSANEEKKPGQMTQTWIQNCYVRGKEATLLRTVKASTALFLEESLVVGQYQPLIRLQGREEDVFHWRCFRSSLIAGQVALRWQTAKSKKETPRIQAWIADSILSRNDAQAPVGDFIQLADGAEPTLMSWRVANSVYAGWKRLLTWDAKPDSVSDLESWRRQWSHSLGDRFILDPWPSNPVLPLEEAPAQAFLPAISASVAYSAATHRGVLGCIIGRLPADPTPWSERTFDPPAPLPIPLADKEVPAISTAADGFFHGDKIDLNKIDDLGAYLANLLPKVKPAPRVVLHIIGKGNRPTSSIQIKGIQNLVMYFEQGKEPLKLVVHPSSIGKRAPLIEMDDGNLELIGARIQLNTLTPVPIILQVKQGNLTLTRCVLQGPLTRLPEGFKAVISMSGNATAPATLLMRDNVLLSGKLLLHLQDQVQVRARNNLFLSFGDGVLCEMTEPLTAMQHFLDHNTWAIRQTTFVLRSGPDVLPSAPTVMCASSNAFLSPFTEEVDKTVFLRGAQQAVARGTWFWQGRSNIYDARLHAYFGAFDKAVPVKQTLADWQKVWGSVGEQDAMLLEAGPPRKTISLDGVPLDDVLLRLDRLTLPPRLRGDPGVEPALIKSLLRKG